MLGVLLQDEVTVQIVQDDDYCELVTVVVSVWGSSFVKEETVQVMQPVSEDLIDRVQDDLRED